ncbi:MAG: hypothetical protein J6A73_05330 [Lachnospiraceae bacterium]|nr:hypothetical protein [Lachnospiraceae bacterium]
MDYNIDKSKMMAGWDCKGITTVESKEKKPSIMYYIKEFFITLLPFVVVFLAFFTASNFIINWAENEVFDSTLLVVIKIALGIVIVGSLLGAAIVRFCGCDADTRIGEFFATVLGGIVSGIVLAIALAIIIAAVVLIIEVVVWIVEAVVWLVNFVTELIETLVLVVENVVEYVVESLEYILANILGFLLVVGAVSMFLLGGGSGEPDGVIVFFRR